MLVPGLGRCIALLQTCSCLIAAKHHIILVDGSTHSFWLNNELRNEGLPTFYLLPRSWQRRWSNYLSAHTFLGWIGLAADCSRRSSRIPSSNHGSGRLGGGSLQYHFALVSLRLIVVFRHALVCSCLHQLEGLAWDGSSLGASSFWQCSWVYTWQVVKRVTLDTVLTHAGGFQVLGILLPCDQALGAPLCLLHMTKSRCWEWS